MTTVALSVGTRRFALALAAAAALVASACGSEVTGGGGSSTTTTHQGAAGAGTTATGTGGTSTGTTAGGSTATGGGGVAGAGGSAVRCNPSVVTCDAPTPACPVGEVPSVDGYCWGPCVPILQCATEPNCDGCQQGFCIEYQAWTIEYRCVLPALHCSALACSCMASYVCAPPFDACQDVTLPSDHDVSCSCPTC